MIVAAGGGERDIAVDLAILNAAAKGNARPSFLNERLMNDLRPTLFLTQLSNLLAGNIAIVHGVCGTSRTFMGEEASSIDAARIALARIASGQSDVALVGAAHNGERSDLLILYEFGDFNLTGEFAPVWARSEKGGFALGSAGVFLVMESKEHAQARGAKPYARLAKVVADLAQRKAPGAVAKSLEFDMVEARRRRRGDPADHRRDRRRTGDIGRAGLPEQASRFCGARHRNLVRSYPGNPVSAGAGAGSTFALARRAVPAERSDRTGG